MTAINTVVLILIALVVGFAVGFDTARRPKE